MPNRALILDANILVRAVLGEKVRQLLAEHSGTLSLMAPQVAYDDARRHLPQIFARRSLPHLNQALAMLDELETSVTPLAEEMYADFHEEVLLRIGRRYPDDWPILAAALAIDCPIWTEDRDFFGTGVATWTTDRVELFFRNTSYT